MFYITEAEGLFAFTSSLPPPPGHDSTTDSGQAAAWHPDPSYTPPAVPRANRTVSACVQHAAPCAPGFAFQGVGFRQRELCSLSATSDGVRLPPQATTTGTCNRTHLTALDVAAQSAGRKGTLVARDGGKDPPQWDTRHHHRCFLALTSSSSSGQDGGCAVPALKVKRRPLRSDQGSAGAAAGPGACFVAGGLCRVEGSRRLWTFMPSTCVADHPSCAPTLPACCSFFAMPASRGRPRLSQPAV